MCQAPSVADAAALIKTDTLEELDLSVVDIRDLLDPIRKLSPYMGGGQATWSIVLAYNTDVYPGDSGPKTWADFFDVEKFPGRRALRNAVAWGGHIQFARLAREPELLNSPEGKEAANTPNREQIEEDFAWFADWVDQRRQRHSVLDQWLRLSPAAYLRRGRHVLRLERSNL